MQQPQQRPDDGSGDYEYDEAHGQVVAGAPGHPERPRTSGAGRPAPEPDGDMSYDEAHDF